MPERMRKRPTKAVNITFRIPLSRVESALEAMQALGIEKIEEDTAATIPWRESEHFRDLPFPGTFLAGFRHREGMTQMELSQRTGIPRRHISEIENGKRPIGKLTAQKLSKVLDEDALHLLLAV
jgi:DNA-binding XRE family transcriptional regulator